MKQILLPTDFSDNSWNSIAYAIHLFKDEDCTFHIFNTYTPTIYKIDYNLEYPSDYGYYDAAEEESKNELETLEAKISEKKLKFSPHTFKTYARFESVTTLIKEFIKSSKIDLIVMGTQGATGAKEVLFGSTTVRVIKSASCPVMAIPARFSYENPHEILFPTDLAIRFNASQLSLLKEIVEQHHARLNAMHVSDAHTLSERQKSNLQELEDIFKGNAFLFHEVKSMKITEAIDEFQIKNKINLLVMLNNKHSFFENVFFKNTIHQIGFHIKIPFLVMPS
ncbi:universal stress protein [Psychroflexus tropicus]|uniref:universal stress protein n=1 Tax=Psychroflexus tropicus TaxID=197345 RepID=UPI00037E1FEA|nr:universal stress protein [Psychroflexus tropicus]